MNIVHNIRQVMATAPPFSANWMRLCRLRQARNDSTWAARVR
jgi:hypothetical protein